MHNGSIGIAPEGYPFVFLSAFTALVFGVLGWWIFAVLFLLFTWFAGHFFRDPERVVPTEKGVAVSPADGKVIKIKQTADPITGEEVMCISIFMNVCNVHVNRSPVAGKITAIAYHPGKFLNAAWDKASTDNERCAYRLETAEGAFTMVQIAGLIARRIVCRVREGEELLRGERFGLIRFGSRVDLYLPNSYAPSVNIGEKVAAGQSILARRQEQAE